MCASFHSCLCVVVVLAVAVLAPPSCSSAPVAPLWMPPIYDLLPTGLCLQLEVGSTSMLHNSSNQGAGARSRRDPNPSRDDPPHTRTTQACTRSGSERRQGRRNASACLSTGTGLISVDGMRCADSNTLRAAHSGHSSTRTRLRFTATRIASQHNATMRMSILVLALLCCVMALALAQVDQVRASQGQHTRAAPCAAIAPLPL